MFIFYILRSIKQETYRLLLSFYLLIDKEIFIGQVLKKSSGKKISLSSPIPAQIAGLDNFYYHFCDSFTDHNKNEEITHKFLLSHSVPEYIKLTNVFYIPSHQCLYSADGKRIDISFANSRRNQIPTKIDIPINFEDISTEFLYIGMLEMLHYGHFLIEGISQLWGLKDYSHYPLLYSGYIWTPKTLFSVRKRHLYIDNFLRLIGIERENLFYFDRPVRIQSIIIPAPSLIFGKQIHTIHKLLPEFAASCLLKTLNQKIQISSQPIYFSRSKLNKSQRFRYIDNEDDLEKYLSIKGVKVVYPESLSLQSQIYLVNKHKYILGTQGSALHNVIFSLNQDMTMICFAGEETWLGTFNMIDKIKSIESHYIFSLEQKCLGNEEWKQDKAINLEATISGLKKIGIF